MNPAAPTSTSNNHFTAACISSLVTQLLSSAAQIPHAVSIHWYQTIVHRRTAEVSVWERPAARLHWPRSGTGHTVCRNSPRRTWKNAPHFLRITVTDKKTWSMPTSGYLLCDAFMASSFDRKCEIEINSAIFKILNIVFFIQIALIHIVIKLHYTCHSLTVWYALHYLTQLHTNLNHLWQNKQHSVRKSKWWHAYSTIGAMVRNFLDAENWTP